ncbi:MAG: WYL domain-containing protein, partial [Proteobacteria bacterium]|nr:WYL domain-containing protein [Pseudomonadota bacterium]
AVAADVSTEELCSLFVARQLTPGLRETPVGRGLDNLWGKLATTKGQVPLPIEETVWRTRDTAPIDYRAHRTVLDTVLQAIRCRRALAIDYRKPDGVESRRTIEPAFLHWDAAVESLYVVAWCRSRDALRTFAIHRILAVTDTVMDFVPHRDAVAAMRNAFRLWARPQSERVILRFSPAVAGEILERRWHASAVATSTDDGGVRLTMEVGAPEELTRLIMGFGPDVRVEEPMSLATRVTELHAAAIGHTHKGLLRAGSAAPDTRRPRAAAAKR